jgi:LCP family protein required for cell wall assembly
MNSMSVPDDAMFIHRTPSTPKRRGCGCVGCLGRLIGALLVLGVLGFLVTWLSFVLFPPFGREPVARVLLVGLDEIDKNHPEMPRRSDAIILMAVRLNGGGATLLSVPRDARVRIPGYRAQRKINAAYALGKVELLRKTLAQESVLNAEVTHYLVFSSVTLAAIVDAAGGVKVDVPFDMNYDDDYQNLHIHLKKGPQMLNGAQAVGYVRWRYNDSGERHAGTDFDRAERQQAVIKAVAKRLVTVDGLFIAPRVYKVFRSKTQSELTFRQLVVLGLNFKNPNAQAVPGTPITRRGISYVECDWATGRTIWEKAIQ